MPQTLEAGFLKADSTNLPIIGTFVVWDFLSKDRRFNLPECQNVKTASSAYKSYGDSVIDYVCLRRDSSICSFKARTMLQMLVAGKKNGLLCIADVTSEKNKKVEVLELAHDKNVINEIIDSAGAFWKGNVYPHLYQAASSQDCK
ncbi:hypothetical protein QAD02_012577 [Eretmocerus hayati]|uniref:Uncharacterized protein n=1 Tax=Eretmocerus hayati TaxID=131215 RepID=A0ACC2P036_9HYME|nr:hypothetical protein QAD02_012577 [Eretmocerus hayati]